MKIIFRVISLLSILLSGLIFFNVAQAERFNGVHHRDWQDWSFDYQVGGRLDGLSLTKVKYKGVDILARASLPVMTVFYDNDVCGPYADRLGGDLTPIDWANNDIVVLREFTQSGRQWLEIGVQDTIGNYVIYQSWYLSADGIIDGHIFSKGLQCNIDHIHYPYWRMDFDLAGTENDQLRKFVGSEWQTVSTESDDNVTSANSHRWQVRDTVTGDSVSIEFGSAGWSSVDGTVDPIDSFENNLIFGRRFKSSEDTGWTYGPHSEVPYKDGESIDSEDIVVWYKGYMPHLASEGQDLWHSTGARFIVNLADSGGNEPPTVTNPGNQENQVGNSVSLQIGASGSSTLSYSATGLPSGLSISEDAGLITGTVSTVGEYSSTVTVSDSNGGSANITFTWVVAVADNEPPVVSDPGVQDGIVEESVNLQIEASGSAPLSYNATGLPTGLSINEDTGLIFGTLSTAGEYSSTVTVTDSNSESAQITITWLIILGGEVDPPTVTNPGIQESQVGDSISLQIEASGVSPLSYSATGLPTGLSISESTGLISGTLSAVGEYSSKVAVNDSDSNSGLTEISFTWQVSADSNSPSSISFDFETDQGWVRNAEGADTASSGKWERTNPSLTSYRGLVLQPENAAEGDFALITDGRSGRYAGSFDIDNGVTTMKSPNIDLTNATQVNLSFSYYFSHLGNATRADYFRVRIIGTRTEATVLTKRGSRAAVKADWKTHNVDISEFAGQSVYIVVEAADRRSRSLVEAGVDDISLSISSP